MNHVASRNYCLGESKIHRRLLSVLVLGLLVGVFWIPMSAHADDVPAGVVEELSTLDAMAADAAQSGHFQEGLEASRAALDLRRQHLGDRHIDTATTLDYVGTFLYYTGDASGALVPYAEALSIYVEVLGPSNDRTLGAANNLSQQAQAAGVPAMSAVAWRVVVQHERDTLGDQSPELGLSLNNLAFFEAEAGEVESATLHYQEALAILTAAHGDDPEIAPIVNNVATFYRDTGRWNLAEPLYRRYIELLSAVDPPDQREIVIAWNNIGHILTEAGRYEEAAEVIQAALQDTKTVFGEDDPTVGIALNNLGLALHHAARYDDAQAAFDEALALQKRTVGLDALDAADTLNNMGMVSSARADYSGAEKLYLRALEIKRAHLPEDHPSIARALHNLAFVQGWQERSEEAIENYMRALQIREAAFGKMHLDTAYTVYALGAIFITTGEYDKALHYLSEALEIRQALLGDEHPEVARVLVDIGIYHFFRGEYEQAERYLRHGLTIRTAILGEDHPDTAYAAVNLGHLFIEKGDFDTAQNLFNAVYQSRLKTFGSEHPMVADALLNLALLQVYAEDFEAAAISAVKADDIHRKVFGERSAMRTFSLKLQSFVAAERGDVPLALELLEDALEFNIAKTGETSVDVAGVLLEIGRIHLYAGDGERAAEEFRKTHQMFVETLGPNHPNVAMSLTELAHAEWHAGRPAVALESLRLAATMDNQQLARMEGAGVNSEPQLLAFKRSLHGRTWSILSMHLFSLPDDAAAAQLAFETVTNRKGRVLDALSDRRTRLRASLQEDDLVAFDALQTANARLSAMVLRGTTHDEEMGALESRISNLEQQLAEASTRFDAHTQTVTLEEVAAALPEDAAFIEFAQFARRSGDATQDWGDVYIAAAVVRSDASVRWFVLGLDQDIEAALAEFQEALLLCSQPGVCETPAGMQAATERARSSGKALHTLLLAPLAPALGDASHYLVSPDGPLSEVPFGALVTPDDRWLIESVAVTWLGSARDLLRMEDVPARSAPLIVAAPDYEHGNEAQDVSQTGTRSSEFAFRKWAPLPGTIEEADAIASLYGGADIMSGAAATEHMLKSVAGPRVLHVATHGFFLADQPQSPDGNDRSRGIMLPVGDGAGAAERVRFPQDIENPLLRAGLVLAGGNHLDDGAGEDGVLTALELSEIDLAGTDLVVLSACETGLGAVENSEGLYGLRRALVLAGSESQVVSLWKVDDAATRDLMTSFARQLQAGMGRSEALRSAKLAMIADPARTHPYYWAAFVISGDWRPLPDLAATEPAPLATEGGGCACHTTRSQIPVPWAALLGLAGFAWFRRRRGRVHG